MCVSPETSSRRKADTPTSQAVAWFAPARVDDRKRAGPRRNRAAAVPPERALSSFSRSMPGRSIPTLSVAPCHHALIGSMSKWFGFQNHFPLLNAAEWASASPDRKPIFVRLRRRTDAPNQRSESKAVRESGLKDSFNEHRKRGSRVELPSRPAGRLSSVSPRNPS